MQAAVKIVLEPVFEADMLPCSFGFRPRRGAHDALQVLIDESWRGRRWVVETDIANCFSAIPHEKLMQAVEERVCDQSVLKLLRAMLRAGVMEDGQVRRPVTGTPQGGVISPLLCNVYLHRIDRAWNVREHGVLVRFADDAVVMCTSREQAEAALARLRELLAELGLEPKEAKTRIVHLQVGGAGFDFLGFHHRLVRVTSRRNHRRSVTFLARWPADRAMQHARDRIRELTRRSRLLLPVEVIVDEVNRFLRGWAAYFRYGNSRGRFEKIKRYVRMRLALVIAKRHRRSRAFGWSGAGLPVPGPPRADQPCREPSSLPGLSGPGGRNRMPAVNGVGKPCAGEPHARIDGRELETETRIGPRPRRRTTHGKPDGHRGSAPTADPRHRASSRPSTTRASSPQSTR